MNYFKVPSKPMIDPNTMSISELKKYKSVEHQKLRRILGNACKGRYFLFAPIGLYILSAPFVSYYSEYHIYGDNNKGGEMLALKTKMTDDDIRYNRELQKLRYLSEPNHTKLNEDTETALAIKKMGGNVELHAPKEDTVKITPHHKLI